MISEAELYAYALYGAKKAHSHNENLLYAARRDNTPNLIQHYEEKVKRAEEIIKELSNKRGDFEEVVFLP